jgi:hypothetical protein
MAVTLFRCRTLLRRLCLSFGSGHSYLASVFRKGVRWSRSKSRSGGILLAQPFGDHSIYVEGALEVNNRRTRLYRKITQLLATIFVAVLSQSLEVVVEHSRMTYQTHPFRVSDRARSDQSATPGADHMECGSGIAVRLKIYIAHVVGSRQISFHLLNSPQYQ